MGSTKALELRRKPTFSLDDLIANSRLPPRPLPMLQDTAATTVSLPRQSAIHHTRVLPMSDSGEDPPKRLDGIMTIAPKSETVHGSGKRFPSLRIRPPAHRVVRYGLSLPVIFVLSVAIGVSYSLAMLKPNVKVWKPQDLSGDTEWVSTTRTHLAQDSTLFLDRFFRNTTIGDDTSVSIDFVKKYSRAVEANVDSTAATFNATWLKPDFILRHGFILAGIMAGSFEGYAIWPCALALPLYPNILQQVCAHDPGGGWFMVEIYNNLVATTSEKASTYLSLEYTPMSLMSARIWAVTPPEVTASGIVLRGYKEGTYTKRALWLLTTLRDQLTLAPITACDRTTQSNALECDRLEEDNMYVRNTAKRDFIPPHKLDKLKVYGPAYAMGNFEAAGKTFVQLPASAIMMTSTGYSATTRFSTNIPLRFTISNGKLKTEAHIYQVATSSPAIGNGFAFPTAQLVVVCLIVYNAIAHCHSTPDVAAREGQIFGFSNHITMGLIARRLGTYKFVFVQLCVHHALNVGKYFTAVYYKTEKVTDTIAFGAEGLLLVIVSSMLLDQLLFFEKYSSVRETLTVVASAGLYVGFLFLQSSFFISIHQVQVTELALCAGANQCVVVQGHEFYYIGLLVVLLLPVGIINGPVHWLVVPTRTHIPPEPVPRDQLTSFEKFCLGIDARREFGTFDRSGGATPLSIVHAAGFTFSGAHLVRVKDYYMVVLVRHLPLAVVESCGLTLTVFRLRDGRVVSGQHMALVAAYHLFREARHDQYVAIR